MLAARLTFIPYRDVCHLPGLIPGEREIVLTVLPKKLVGGFWHDLNDRLTWRDLDHTDDQFFDRDRNDQ